MHAYNVPSLAPLARDAALRYQESATLTQFRHMSFRIFVRLGMWQELIDATYKVMNKVVGDTDVNAPPPVPPPSFFLDNETAWIPLPSIPNTLHNEWLDAAAHYHYANLQRGNDAAAKWIFQNVLKHALEDPESEEGRWMVTGILYRHAIELDMWTFLGGKNDRPPASIVNDSRSEMVFQYFRILAQARTLRDRYTLKISWEALVAANNTLVNDYPGYAYYPNWHRAEIAAIYGAGLGWRNFADNDIQESANIMPQVDGVLMMFTPPHLPIVVPMEQLGEMNALDNRMDETLANYQQSLAAYPYRLISQLGVGSYYLSKSDDYNTTYWFTAVLRQCADGECATRGYIRPVRDFIHALKTQVRIDGWGLFLILAGGAFIAVTVAGSVALHYHENPGMFQFDNLFFFFHFHVGFDSLQLSDLDFGRLDVFFAFSVKRLKFGFLVLHAI
jgi:hypothetical protein